MLCALFPWEVQWATQLALTTSTGLCRVQLQSGQWQVCMVMELADPDRHGLRGPSLWDCMEACMETNMRACVYTPRTARPDAFTRPVVGGEPIVRWIFLQVRQTSRSSCTSENHRVEQHAFPRRSDVQQQ